MRVNKVKLVTLTGVVFVDLQQGVSLGGQQVVGRSCGLSRVNKIITMIHDIIGYIFLTRKVNTILCTFYFMPRFKVGGNLIRTVFLTMSTFYGTKVSLFKRADLSMCIDGPLIGVAAVNLVVISNLKFVI